MCFNCCIILSKHRKKKNPENSKPFIDQYNWKEIDFPSQRKGWKSFQSNNKLIVLNILYVLYNNE